MGKAGKILLLLLCMMLCTACASGQEEQRTREEQETQDLLPDGEGDAKDHVPETGERKPEEEEPDIEVPDIQEAEFSSERQMQENEALFLEKAEAQKVETELAEELLGRLLTDGIFQDGDMALTGLRIDDIDGNGQVDMLVMVLEAKELPAYGAGGLWFYMNEDEPYCFEEEACSFCGWFDAFWADVDNDENIEIVFSAEGTGCGAVGDFYKAVFKYKGHVIERMELPSDLEEDYDCGLRVELVQEPPDSLQIAGGNARGFYNLCAAEYEGKRVLQASEYLYGEGGIVHNVATAQFLITWEKDGTPKVFKWWIEEAEDGYYYYASQSDHYYLYRAGKDGSEPQRLAKVHPVGICVQDDEIYFINQSDGHGIYRMKTDGSGMEKLYDYGKELRLSAEYVFFCSTYRAEYDKTGMVTEETSEFESSISSGDFLYRMKRDGSEPELIATNIWKYALGNENGQKMRYAGFLYCSKRIENKISVCRMDLNGQSEEELCRFDIGGSAMVYGDNIYYAGFYYEDRERVSRYCFRDGKITTFEVPEYTNCCIYNGRFYGINEVMEENGREITVYRMDYDMKSYEILYEEFFPCESARKIAVSDLYASGEGIFFRKFVSPTEGCQWFRLVEDDMTGEWRAEEWEDKEKIPETIYEEAMKGKEAFYGMLEENNPENVTTWYQMVDYGHVYIGEDYITVAKYEEGHRGGKRHWTVQEPVTFDRKSGEKVSLEEILGMSEQEAVAELTGSVYKYMDGIGIYYEQDAIDCSTAGDYMFVIPYGNAAS